MDFHRSWHQIVQSVNVTGSGNSSASEIFLPPSLGSDWTWKPKESLLYIFQLSRGKKYFDFTEIPTKLLVPESFIKPFGRMVSQDRRCWLSGTGVWQFPWNNKTKSGKEGPSKENWQADHESKRKCISGREKQNPSKIPFLMVFPSHCEYKFFFFLSLRFFRKWEKQ